MTWGNEYNEVMMSGGMLFWGAVCILLVALGIWLLVRWMKRSSTQNTLNRAVPTQPSAMDVLQQRYARGEIDTSTFESTREQLQATANRQ
jgi:putative membrane protein